MREIRVGLAGLGHVGSAVARLLLDSSDRFAERLGAKVVLHAVADRHPAKKVKALKLPRRVRVSKDWRSLVDDPAVDIVVELVGGWDDARELVLGSMRKGKDVVTANKALLSKHWPEVMDTAWREGRKLGFEASVAGGIPIIGPLAQSLTANKVRQILGILNGTTNYILSSMVSRRLPQDVILKEAQAMGLAEADPTLDLNGSDAAHKLSVLASIVLGRWLKPGQVQREGIEKVDLEDVLFSIEQLERTVRLLARVRFNEDGTVEAGVAPTLVPLSHPLAAVHGGYNAVLVETSEAGDLMFYGRGAGPGPAASAVVGDILNIAEGLVGGRTVAPAQWAKGEFELKAPEDRVSQFFLRFDAQDRPGVLGRIATELGRQGVSIEQVYQPKADKRSVPIVIVTHEAREGSVRKAIRSAAASAGVARSVVVLRML